MLNNLIVDDFFDNPDEIRGIGLSRYFRYGGVNNGGWKGERSFSIRDLGNTCPCCQQEINPGFRSEQNFLIEKSQKIFDVCKEHYNIEDENIIITSYFHITTEETKNSMPYFSQEKFHQDTCLVAGVVYLTPDAPPSAGTSILYAEENKFVNLENKYNRLVAYESHRIHALSDTFGTTKETGRLTFTFFLHHRDDLLEAT